MAIAKIIAEAIATKLIRHRYADEVAAIRAENQALAEECYILKWTPHKIAMMAAVPEGWLDQTNQMTAITNQGYKITLSFGGAQSFAHMPAGISQSVLWPKANVYGNIEYAVKGEIAERLHTHASTIIDMQACIKRDHERVTAIIKAQSTVAKLIESWPEIEPFARDYLPIAKDQLPAIRTDELNARFKLPA